VLCGPWLRGSLSQLRALNVPAYGLLAFPLRSLVLCFTMPRDGAFTLSDVRSPVLTVVCDPCGRLERHDVEWLTRQYGWDAKLTDLLTELVADCPKRRAVSVYDRCKAVFERGGDET
jgi:hypothetical protein